MFSIVALCSCWLEMISWTHHLMRLNSSLMLAHLAPVRWSSCWPLLSLVLFSRWFLYYALDFICKQNVETVWSRLYVVHVWNMAPRALLSSRRASIRIQFPVVCCSCALDWRNTRGPDGWPKAGESEAVVHGTATDAWIPGNDSSIPAVLISPSFHSAESMRGFCWL